MADTDARGGHKDLGRGVGRAGGASGGRGVGRAGWTFSDDRRPASPLIAARGSPAAWSKPRHVPRLVPSHAPPAAPPFQRLSRLPPAVQ